MKKKSLLCLILALVMLITLLSGCGGKNKFRTIDDIKKSGELIMGTSADYPPYEFHMEINGEDTIVGADIEFGKYFAKELGVELKIVDMPFDSLLISLQKGEFDLVLAGMNPDEKRLKSADFSESFVSNDQIVLIRAEDADTLTSVEALQGHKVGVQTGSAAVDLAVNAYGEENVIALVKNQDLIMELLNGKIDAVQSTTTTAMPYIAANEGKLVIQDVGFPDLEVGAAAAVMKGNTELVEFLNGCIADMRAEGLIEQYISDCSELAGVE